VPLYVSVMLPVGAVFSLVTLATAPVPPTTLQIKTGVSGQVFVKLIAMVGFAAVVPLAVTDAAPPHALDSVMFDGPIELPRFASKKIPCTLPA